MKLKNEAPAPAGEFFIAWNGGECVRVLVNNMECVIGKVTLAG